MKARRCDAKRLVGSFSQKCITHYLFFVIGKVHIVIHCFWSAHDSLAIAIFGF